MSRNGTRSSRSSRQNTRNSSRSGRTINTNSNRNSDGFGNSALADSVRATTRNTNRILESRGSSRRFAVGDQQAVNDTTINSEMMGQTRPIELPTQAEPINYNGVIQGNNSATASMLSSLGYTLDNNGQFVQDLQTNAPAGGASGLDAGAQGRFSNLVASLGLMPQKQSVYDDKEYQRQQKAVQREQRNLNNYTANLNSIVAKSQADQLSVTGQGRGIPEAIIGGQQAQIAKEAAIQALPVQAQIAASQGNLELATAQLDQLYKIKSESLQNDYEYKANQYNAIRDFLTKEESRQLSLLDQENDRAYSEGRDFLQLQDSYMKAAIENGTSTVGISGARNRAELYKAVGSSTNSNLGGGETQLYRGLNSPTATAVRGIVSGFKSEPQVTNFTAVQDGYNFANSIAVDTTNPSDDQGLIYAFAKVMDPGSVVREGEYATVQKYAQSWVKAYGKGITQAIDGTGFLSQEARQNIKKTIKTKYQSSKSSYDTVTDSYAEQINNLTGRDDGNRFLRNYAVDNLAQAPVTSASDDDRTTPTPVNSWWKNLGAWLWGSN